MLSEIVYALTLQSYDYSANHMSMLEVYNAVDEKKREILYELCRLLFQTLQRRLTETSLNIVKLHTISEKIVFFLEFLKRLPLKIQQEITQGIPIPEIPLMERKVTYTSPLTVALTNTLKEELQKVTAKSKDEEEETALEIQYSIDNNYEAVKKGLFPVDIMLKKNEEILVFIDLPDSRVFRDPQKTIVRRRYRFKEFLHRHDYPTIPFLRYPFLTPTSADLQHVTNDILSIIHGK
jgi:hypothetical protein